MKLRYTFTAIWEADFDPANYVDSTVEPPKAMPYAEALECDRAAILEDPAAFLDSAGCKLDLKITEVR